MLLTDLHPDTTQKLGWKRSFRTGEQEVVLKTWSHSREKLVAAFRDEAFEIEFELQPEFGEQERAIFDAAGKAREFDRASGEPALLVLGFKPSARITESSGPANTLQITGARVALDACTSVEAAVEVREDRIESIRTFGQTEHASPPRARSHLAIFCCPASSTPTIIWNLLYFRGLEIARTRTPMSGRSISTVPKMSQSAACGKSTNPPAFGGEGFATCSAV